MTRVFPYEKAVQDLHAYVKYEKVMLLVLCRSKLGNTEIAFANVELSIFLKMARHGGNHES